MIIAPVIFDYLTVLNRAGVIDNRVEASAMHALQTNRRTKGGPGRVFAPTKRKQPAG